MIPRSAMRRCILPLLLIWRFSTTRAFLLMSPDAFLRALRRTPSLQHTQLLLLDPRSPPALSSSALAAAKLWDRLQIEEDPEPYWYILNCVATQEMDLLRQCQVVCADMMPDDVVKFVVPTERKTRSHGANKMVTETKVKYPGYVFAKLRLCPRVYEAIQGLDFCRSWMGTVNRKGYNKLPPAPLALNEMEVEKFGLEECEEIDDQDGEDETGVIVDIADEADMKSKIDQDAVKAFQGLKVGDMVKVTAVGKLYNEDGIVRRLKDGKIFVRFYTYGTIFEEWMDPSDMRKLNDLEVLRGLSGPSQPITQEAFDGSNRRNDMPLNDSRRRGDIRLGFMDGGVQRNRRQDRVADRFKRKNQDSSDAGFRNDRNWNWYQDEQRQRQASSASDTGWNMQAGSNRPRSGRKDSDALTDADSQWGRKPQRQERREPSRNVDRRTEAAIDGDGDWSAFVSPAFSPGGASGRSDTDDFFASLMKDLDSKKGSDGGPRSDGQGINDSLDRSEQDAFLNSLTSDLSDEQSQRQSYGSSDTDWDMRAGSNRPRRGRNDDALTDTDSQWGRKPQRQQRREQSRYVNRDNDRSAFVSPAASPNGASGRSDTDDFFASLMKDLDSKKGSDGAPWDRNDSVDRSEQDAFLNSLVSDLSDDLVGEPLKPWQRESNSKSQPRKQRTSQPRLQRTTQPTKEDEDFFVSLEAELGSALGAESVSSSTDTDDFFTQLEAELSPSEPLETTVGVVDMNGLLKDLFNDQNVKDTKAKVKSKSKGAAPVLPVEAELSRPELQNKPPADVDMDVSRKKQFDDQYVPYRNVKVKSTSEDAAPVLPRKQPGKAPTPPAPDASSLNECTVPVLKDMLRSQGLKVSGKKSELIERLIRKE